MARQLYRKSMLELMSSPDQLDKMIVITSPSFWLALLGGAVVVGVALVWSIFGRLPINLEASGIFVSDQMSYTLASDTGGIVASLEVEVGDYVEEGDILLMLADDAAQRELSALQERRAKVEAVTLTSVNDVATADNRDLINLKTQLGATGAEAAQNRAMLTVYEKELESLRPRVTAAKKKMETARKSYYSYIESHSDSEIEIGFSEAQSRYQQASSAFASAEASFSNTGNSYYNAVQSIKDNLSITLTSALSAADQALSTAEQALVALGDTNADGVIDTGSGEAFADGKSESDLRAAKENADAAQAVVDALNGLKTKIYNLSPGSAPASFEFLLSTTLPGGSTPLLDVSTYSQLQSLYGQYQSSAEVYLSAESAYISAEKEYKEAKEAYTAYVDGRAEIDAEKERLGTVYNQLSSDYNALYSQQTNLEANITSIKGQLWAANVGASVQSDSYEEQFASARAAVLSSLDAEIEKYQYSLDKTNIRATVSGSVTDIKVGVGAAVGQGSEVVTLRQLAEEDHIICYIPISSGKKVTPGMEAIVTPTTVNRQEYGHMKAKVVAVDDYVTPASSIYSALGDDALAQAFLQNGPVVAVTCRLYPDETTASGYWWSSKKGADLLVPEGTMVSVDVVTEEKAPITMLVPYLKEKLTMAVEPGAGSEEGGQ